MLNMLQMPSVAVIHVHYSFVVLHDIYLPFRLVLDGASLIAIHKAKYYKRPDGLALGPGPFVQGLEYATGVTATVVGKPERAFFTEALVSLGCRPEDAVMIGDVSNPI